MVPDKIDSYINNTEKRRFHLNDTWVPSLFSFICPLYLDKSNLKLFPYLSVNLVIFVTVQHFPTLSFFVGICYGFQVMKSNESPDVPFTILRTRFHIGKPHYYYIF